MRIFGATILIIGTILFVFNILDFSPSNASGLGEGINYGWGPRAGIAIGSALILGGVLALKSRKRN
jgi:hypothetical protein